MISSRPTTQYTVPVRVFQYPIIYLFIGGRRARNHLGMQYAIHSVIVCYTWYRTCNIQMISPRCCNSSSAAIDSSTHDIATSTTNNIMTSLKRIAEWSCRLTFVSTFIYGFICYCGHTFGQVFNYWYIPIESLIAVGIAAQSDDDSEKLVRLTSLTHKFV